jgi:transcriptional regulator with XRE-family HTH domain
MPKSTLTVNQSAYFAEWLLSHRERKHYTQIEMAEWLGLSQSHYNALEKKRKQPTKKMIYQIAKKLNDLSIVTQLFGDESSFVSDEKESTPDRLPFFLDWIEIDPPFLEEEIKSYDWTDVNSFVLPIRQGRPLKFRPVPPVMYRWGYHEGQYVLLQPVEDVNTLQDQQLVYLHQGGWHTSSGFAVVDREVPNSALRSLESAWITWMELSLAEQEQLQMDKMPTYYPWAFRQEGEYGLYEVIGIFEPQPVPLKWPLVPNEGVRHLPASLMKPSLMSLFTLSQRHDDYIRLENQYQTIQDVSQHLKDVSQRLSDFIDQQYEERPKEIKHHMDYVDALRHYF